MKVTNFFDDVEEPSKWLRQVVVRLAVSRLRRRQVWDRLKQLIASERTPPVGGRLEFGEVAVRMDLEAAIRRLPPTQRGAIVLHYYFGADYREVAVSLGLELSSVGKTLARARASLRGYLG